MPQGSTPATVVHPLARPGEPFGQISFKHTDGTLHTYTSCVNDMTGDRLSYFDDAAPSIGATPAEVRQTFRRIRKRAAAVIAVIGDF